MFHLFLYLLTLYYVEASIDWSYAEQTNWYQNYSECGGSRQSPIDISPDLLVLNTSTKVEFINFAHSSTEYEVVNNGHSVQFNYKGKEKSVPKIRGLNGGTYELVQFHIHWGMVHLVGSEHTINGQRFDMEFHMVFFNRDKYPDYQTALDSHQDGVLVLAVFNEIQRANAPELTNFLRVVGRFSRNPKSETEFALKLEDFVPRHKGSAPMEMFTYIGSFTTPPCTEGITWLLVPKPNPIGEQQLSERNERNEGASASERLSEVSGVRSAFGRSSNALSTVKVEGNVSIEMCGNFVNKFSQERDQPLWSIKVMLTRHVPGKKPIKGI